MTAETNKKLLLEAVRTAIADRNRTWERIAIPGSAFAYGTRLGEHYRLGDINQYALVVTGNAHCDTRVWLTTVQRNVKLVWPSPHVRLGLRVDTQDDIVAWATERHEYDQAEDKRKIDEEKENKKREAEQEIEADLRAAFSLLQGHGR